jgi:ribonuclease VapC
MSFIDASAMVAILLQETAGERLARAIDSDVSPFTNVIAIWETAAALYRKLNLDMSSAQACVDEFIEAAGISVLPVSPGELGLALDAFAAYGRHRFPGPADRNKGLNLADCFHYASAKSRRAPILTTDEGFAATDLATGASY